MYQVVKFPPDPYAIGPDTSSPPTVVYETRFLFWAEYVSRFLAGRDPANWYYVI